MLAALKLSQPAYLRPGFDLHRGKRDAYFEQLLSGQNREASVIIYLVGIAIELMLKGGGLRV